MRFRRLYPGRVQARTTVCVDDVATPVTFEIERRGRRDWRVTAERDDTVVLVTEHALDLKMAKRSAVTIAANGLETYDDLRWVVRSEPTRCPR